MDQSEELQRRMRHYQETLGGAQQQVLGETSLRESIIALGAKPVALSDLLSAVPTWMAQYEKTMRETGVHGDAVFMADRSVRRAHGSTAITSRPGVARGGGALGAWLSSLYGFFSHILNRQYEMAWKAGEVLDLAKHGEFKEAMAKTPEVAGMFFSYVIFPAMIEEAVTPFTNDEKESWAKKAGKALIHSTSSSWIVVRDLVSAAIYGRDPSAGLLSSTLKTGTDLARDLGHGKEAFSKQRAGNLLYHSATALGALTGFTNAQEGRVAKFMYNYSQGKERPKGPWGWLVGLRFGQLKGHSPTIADWMKGRVQK
jgi:hypothetical protein